MGHETEYVEGGIDWGNLYTGHEDVAYGWNSPALNYVGDKVTDEATEKVIEGIRSLLTEIFAAFGVGVATLANRVPYEIDPWMEPPVNIDASVTLNLSLGTDCVDDTHHRTLPLGLATQLLPNSCHTRRLDSCAWDGTVFDMYCALQLSESPINGHRMLLRYITGPGDESIWADWQ